MTAQRVGRPMVGVLVGHNVECLSEGPYKGWRGFVWLQQKFGSVVVDFDGVSVQFVTTHHGAVEERLRILPVVAS